MKPNPVTAVDLTIFWAKWNAPANGIASYHPLLCHLIDVSMVTETMWERSFPEAWKTRVSRGLGLSMEAAKQWVVYCGGAHDLGKMCPGFQAQLRQRFPASHALVSERLNQAKLPYQGAEWIAHGMVSARALNKILPHQFGLAQRDARMIATAVGGHHGIFFSGNEERACRSLSVGENSWDAVRLQCALALAEVLGLPEQVPHGITTGVAMALAGAISVADWIGSIASRFHHMVPDARSLPTIDYMAYRQQSKQIAGQVLEELGWLSWHPTHEQMAFQALFPQIEQLRPLQKEAVELAGHLHGPGMVIVEAPMGEGKTEAGVFLGDTWNVAPGMGGMYVALPTQATSNSMYRRIATYLEQRFPNLSTPLHLLHGRSTQSDAFQDALQRGREPLLPEGIDEGTSNINDGNQRTGNVIAAEWFANQKRQLLAPFGVGTVDQILLGALQIKHGFVRLFALSTKVVLIDEVHAYDTYMTTLLERLLKWLGAMGVPVVLLSATLPAERRQTLLTNYAKGAQWSTHTPATETRYPRMTWMTAEGCDSKAFAPDPRRAQRLQLRWLGDDPQEVVDQLRTLLADGGCAAVICSTVRRAQTLWALLHDAFPGLASDGEPLVDLFHAQYPFEERAKREARALQRFGKDDNHLQRAILVATQVIEQSLDLDFDVMISDIAPIDLLLQRSGRLHRHQRSNRPPRLKSPILFIRGAPANPENPMFDRGIEFVYAPHLLLRTWLLLRERGEVVIPDEIEPLVEWVYGERDCPEGLGEGVMARWEKTAQALEKAHKEEQSEAIDRYIKAPENETDLATIYADPREEDAPDIHPKLQALTRLGEPTVEVICLYGTFEEAQLRHGEEPFSLRPKPNHEQILDLQQRSMRLSQAGIVQSILAWEIPKGWREVGPLCRCRALFFDEAGVALVGAYQLRLDPDLGLVIERADRA